MSYIYEALKRAQQENESADVLPRARARSGVFAGRSRWWLWAVIGVLAVNVVVLAAVVVRDRPGPPAAVAVSAVPPAPIVNSTVAPVAEARAPEAPVAALAPAVAPATPVPPPLPRVTAREAVASPQAAVAPPPSARSAIAPPMRAPQAPPEVPPRSPAPGVEPPSTPVAAPKVTLQVIVYSDTPSQRMVFIDGRRYVEGDAFDSDTVLERITADGVVMKRRGERFVISERRP